MRGSVKDNEMVSAAEAWKDGCRIWSVVDDPAEGDEHLESQGEPPESFATIRARLQAAQAAETGPVDHIFDIPVESAKHLTGYHPDENIPGAQFETLAEASWFARVFRLWNLWIVNLTHNVEQSLPNWNL